MEWFETESRKQIADTAGKFAQKELLGRSREAGEVAVPGMPWEAVRHAGTMGLLAAPLPEELGGVGMDTVSETILWDRIAGGLAGAATLMAFHSAGLAVLAALQELPAVRTWLEKDLLEDNDGIPALVGLAIPEPVTDLDGPASPSLVESGEKGKAQAVLGTFLCLPGLSAAGRLVFLLPEGEQAASIGWMEARNAGSFFTQSHPGSGLEELSVGRLTFSNDLPEGMEFLCQGEKASSEAGKVLTRLRISLAAIQTGNAEAAWIEAREYSVQRVQTGRIIAEHQEVRKMLETMEIQIQACRSFVYRAAALAEDQADSDSVAQIARQAHLFCDEAAESVCLDAIQVLGGYGYMKDYGVEKRLRDCKSLQAILGSHPVDWLGGSS